jgi:hypothetical protein
MVWLLLYQGLFIMESDDSLDDFVASDEIWVKLESNQLAELNANFYEDSYAPEHEDFEVFWANFHYYRVFPAAEICFKQFKPLYIPSSDLGTPGLPPLDTGLSSFCTPEPEAVAILSTKMVTIKSVIYYYAHVWFEYSKLTPVVGPIN